MKILIIEDDQKISSYIAKGIEEAGHQSQQASDGETGLAMAREHPFDVMIVDRMLPKLDGLKVIETIRQEQNQTPALILSALGEVNDRVTGLKAGGDDYLVKPFSFIELLARIEVLHKRQQIQDNNPNVNLHARDLTLDLISREVIRGDTVIKLQSREFQLLEYMLRNKGKIVTRTMLLENVWHYHFDPQTNVIDVHISRLRSKIDHGFDESIIRTVRGAGYIIED